MVTDGQMSCEILLGSAGVDITSDIEAKRR